jgi:PAS domain S-box-containing protein
MKTAAVHRPLSTAAEARLRRRHSSPLSAGSLKAMIHELSVHQIEVEMQNEELRQAELALARSRDRYSELYDFAPVGFVTLDKEDRIVEANLAAARLLGTGRNHLLGQRFRRFLPRESTDAFHLHKQEIFVEKNRHACGLTLQAADGRKFPVRLESSPFEEAGGGRRLCHAVFLDMSAAQAAEDARRAQEEQYRVLFDWSPNPMFDFEEQTLRFLAVNRAASELYGWSRAEFLGMTLKDIRPPEDVPLLMEKLAEQSSPKMDYVGEWRHRKKNGGVFHVDLNASRLEFAGRDARLVIVTDVTHRKQMEQALRSVNEMLERRVAQRTRTLSESNARLQAIMDGAQIGILTYNRQGIIGSANPAAMRIFGEEDGALTGLDIRSLVEAAPHGQPVQFFELPPPARRQQAAVASQEVHARRKDGAEITLELTMAGFAPYRRRQFVALVNDISGRKKLERALLEAGENERRRLGHELHDSLGQQLHGLQYKAALLEADLRKETPALAREAGKLTRHITQAIELARGLARGLQPVPAEPEGLMQTLKELAKRTQELFGLKCRFECPEPVLVHRPHVASHLYRIAQEAVNNALKHGKPTFIRIHLAATPQRVMLGIRDNGRGIRRSARRGSGMGLHIMQQRADAIRGSLLVQRLRGRGTEVVCTVVRPALAHEGSPLRTGE